MNLYKIHYSWSTGAVSSSDIKYYESEEPFKVDLLKHHLDIMYSSRGPDNWFKMMKASLWRKFYGPDGEPRERRTKRIILAQKVDNGEWVDVDYHFIEPEVVIE